MTKVKICGITNLGDALLAEKCGANQLGFNFFKGSPRYMTPEEAKTIIRELSADVTKTGVFVNESVERICEIAGIAGLDTIQLHGDEDNRFIEEVHMMTGLAIIKALRILVGFSPDEAKHSSAEAILLDNYSPRDRGGTGDIFDWKIAAAVRPLVERLYLAGGLTHINVGEAIGTVRPYAVDACSGLESSPGKKDPARVKQFIDAARKADGF